MMNARNAFIKSIMGGKLILLLVFVIFSFINGYKDYVEKNPRKFMTDAIIVGVTGAIAATFMCFTRGRPDLWVNHAFIAMLFFFFYHVTREFSGYFKIKDDIANKDSKFKKPLAITAAVIFGLLLLLVLYNHDTPNFSQGILSGQNSFMAFFIEALFTTLIFTIGESVVAYNHDELSLMSVLETIAIYGGGHIMLQFGGFYAFLYEEHK